MSGVGDLLIRPLVGLPEFSTGDDLAGLLAEAIGRVGGARPGDVLVVSAKVVSKVAGLRADPRARAATVLAESTRVVAERATATGLTRIVATHAGPVLAGAGIDASNTGPDETLLLLPRDPDAAAAGLRTEVLAALGGLDPFGVVLTDTAGRPWRAGLADIALGVAGLPPVDDLRGARDADDRPLGVTVRAIADELAGAADLVKGKAERVPAALIRGLRWPRGPHAAGPHDAAADGTGHAVADGTGDAVADRTGEAVADGTAHVGVGASALVRRGAEDWFALGHLEAVRSALGVRPGTPAAVDVGIPAAGGDDLADAVARACAVATHAEGLGRLPAGHPRTHLVADPPRPDRASTHLRQYGVTVEAPDDLTLGVVAARLVAALAGEGVPAVLAQADGAASGRPARALVVFAGVG